MREDSLANQSNDPADENSRAYKESGSAGAGLFGNRGLRRRFADLFHGFTCDVACRTALVEVVGVLHLCQRAYSLILLSSVL